MQEAQVNYTTFIEECRTAMADGYSDAATTGHLKDRGDVSVATGSRGRTPKYPAYPGNTCRLWRKLRYPFLQSLSISSYGVNTRYNGGVRSLSPQRCSPHLGLHVVKKRGRWTRWSVRS